MQTILRVLNLERTAERPTPGHLVPMPPEAVIYNGPRPLLGSPGADGVGLAWDANGPRGVFFAALLPDDPQRERWLAYNREQGAVELRAVTIAEVRAQLRAHYTTVIGLTPAEADQALAVPDAPAWFEYQREQLDQEPEPA